jgi:adenosine kinase
LSLERSTQVGALLATLVLETVGTQEYVVHADEFVKRLADSYGDDAAEDVRPHLSALPTR